MSKLKIQLIKIFILLIITFLIVNPVKVSAHVGGGPPFLKVNGKYAQTNPYYQGGTTINIAQDLTSQSYDKGKKIEFSIDLVELAKQSIIPEGFAKSLKFRWSVGSGDNFDQISKDLQYGQNVTYDFKSPKSYLVIVEAKAPTDQDYIIIDTVQVDVLPNRGYKIPEESIFVGTQDNNSQKPVLFVSTSSFDKTSRAERYIWDFNDGKLENKKNTTRTFSHLSTYGIGIIYLRVIDGQGLIRDVGFNMEDVNGQTLQFGPFGNMKRIAVTFGTYNEAVLKENITQSSDKTNSNLSFYLLGLIAMFIIFIVSVGFYLKNRQF